MGDSLATTVITRSIRKAISKGYKWPSSTCYNVWIRQVFESSASKAYMRVLSSDEFCKAMWGQDFKAMQIQFCQSPNPVQFLMENS